MINTDALNARVINVDSRLRHNGTAENCQIALLEPLDLPSTAVCWVTAVNIPFSWPNVSSLNDQLYVTERLTEENSVPPFIGGAAGSWTRSAGASKTWAAGAINRTYTFDEAHGEQHTIVFTEWDDQQLTKFEETPYTGCLLYTSPSPRDS